MKKIKDLLDKYYIGETSLEEELSLREYFQAKNIPAELSFHKEQFAYYDSEKSKEELKSDFDDKVLNEISSFKVSKLPVYFRTTWFRAASVAAGFLLIFGLTAIFYFSNPIGEKNKIAISAEELFAYEQTVDALLTASKYIKKANHELEKISIINRTTEALDEVNYIEKYNKYVLNLLGDES